MRGDAQARRRSRAHLDQKLQSLSVVNPGLHARIAPERFIFRRVIDVAFEFILVAVQWPDNTCLR